MVLDAFFLSILAGVVSGILTGGIFYWLAGKDLKEKVLKLANLNRIVIQAVENAGFIEVNRDAQGNPIGIVFRVHAESGVQVGGSATPSAHFQAHPSGGGPQIGGSTASSAAYHVQPSGGVQVGGSAPPQVTRAQSDENTAEQ